MQRIKLLILIFLCGLGVNAQTALPETGYRWVLNEDLSDEFEGNTLNLDKWKNTDPKKWMGRAPGIFKKNTVSLVEGNMCITTDKLPEPEVYKGETFTHAGGHVISRKKVKLGSFIECSMKANKTFMSSTFWLINYANEGKGCNRRTTELDIQECIGFPADKKQTQEMGSNTHSRNISPNCTDVEKGSRGARCEMPGKAYDSYYTYGVWWKSPRELLFYLNGEYKYTIEPKADFNLDMYIKMVCETYNWSPVPADGGMNGNWNERTTFYDWVRTYSYVPIDKKQKVSKKVSKIFEEEVLFSEKHTRVLISDLSIPVAYKANTDKKLVLTLKNSKGKEVSKMKKIVYAGHGNIAFHISDKLTEGNYSAEATLYSVKGKKLSASAKYDLEIISKPSGIDN